MENTKSKHPENMSRVLLEHINGSLEFGYFKDGMFKCESGGQWMSPLAIVKWMSIKELKALLAAQKTVQIMNFLEQDEFVMYKNAPNYIACRAAVIANDKFNAREKLEKIPKCIRYFFAAL